MDVKPGDWVRLKPLKMVRYIGRDKVELFIDEHTSMFLDRDRIESIVPPPEPDWSKVPKGTLVEVRDYDIDKWRSAVYLCFVGEESFSHLAKTQESMVYEAWRFCRLADGRGDE